MIFCHVPLQVSIPKLQQINEDGTRFYVTPEGNKYPSVTTVLSEYNRQSISEWRKKVGNEQANLISSKASLRGTKFHKLCEQYLQNQSLEFATPIEQHSFKVFEPVLQRINNIHLQEQRMYSNHLRMAGTVDCIAEFDGKLAVVDFKTASRQKDKSYIENYFMQCSAYAIMFEEIFKIPVPKIVVAIAVEDEEPQVFIEKRDDYVKNLLHYRNLYESNHPSKSDRVSVAGGVRTYS